MATTPLKNPYDTGVLPAVPLMAPRPPARVLPATPLRPARPAPSTVARRRLVMELHGEHQLEIWDDRVVTHEQVFALDDSFDARLTADWRAPLTVEAPLGLALRDYRGRWNIYVPVDEEQLWHAAAVLRTVCAARGLDLRDLVPSGDDAEDTVEDEEADGSHWAADQPTSMPTPTASDPAPTAARHRYAHTYATPQVRLGPESAPWRAPLASQPVASQPVASQLVASQLVASQPVASQPAPAATWSAVPQPAPRAPLPAVELTSDTVLIAITHLSVVFLPVVLPLTVWLALRRNVPVVADQARQALGFQAVVAALGALLLGFAVHGALTHASAAAAIGLAAFVALLAVAAVCAFWVALGAMRGAAARYRDLLEVFRRG